MVIVFDTMCAAHLGNEEIPLSLETQATINLGVGSWGKGVHEFGDKQRPPTPFYGPDGLAFYNARDTAYTHLLAEVEKDALGGDPELSKLLKFLIIPGLEALNSMEMNGIWVDTTRVSERRLALEEEQKGHHAKMLEFLPDDFKDSADFSNDNFIRRWIFGEKPDGLGLDPISWTEKTNQAQVDSKVLARLNHPAIDILKEYKKNIKSLQFLVAWDQWLDKHNRMHPRFNPTGTITGRRSADSPNIMQVPRGILIRSCIGAPTGWKFLEVDYSMLEVRIAAWFSQEPTLLKIFSDPKGDVYRYTAALVNNKPEHEVTKEERQSAKAIVLGFLYGMGAKKFVEYAKTTYNVEFEYDEARAFREVFFTTYSGLVKWHAEMRRLARQKLMVRSPVGRIRHLTMMLSNNEYEQNAAEREAINAPVQGMGGDFTLAANVSLCKNLPPDEILLVGDIHDALLFQVRDDVWEKWANIVLRIMENPPEMKRFHLDIPVRLKAEAKVSQYWSESILENNKPPKGFTLDDFISTTDLEPAIRRQVVD